MKEGRNEGETGRWTEERRNGGTKEQMNEEVNGTGNGGTRNQISKNEGNLILRGENISL